MASTAVLETRERAQRILAELGVVKVDSDGDLMIRNGSTAVFVRVFESSDNRLFVKVEAPISVGVQTSPEFYRWVATHTDDWTFGHLAILDQQDSQGNPSTVLVMRHMLIGSTMDPEELRTAVVFVALSADRVDDDVVRQFGGRTFFEGD